MASLNKVILIGNLTRDPEQRAIPSGLSISNFGIAVGRISSKQGEKETDFFNVVAFGKLAEICSQYLKKGSSVAIEGRLQYSSWETPEGQKRSKVEVVANNVQFLSKATGSSENQAPNNTQNTQDTSSNLEPVGAQNDNLEGIPDDDVPF